MTVVEAQHGHEAPVFKLGDTSNIKPFKSKAGAGKGTAREGGAYASGQSA